MSDRMGHTWRTYDGEPYCAGCGTEPGERTATEPCPNAECRTCNDSGEVILADDYDGQGRYQPLVDECPDCPHGRGPGQ